MSMEPLPTGTLLNGRYRLLEVIGRGGMGTVYKAEHVRLDTILAVKEVRVQLESEAERQAAIDQCEQEARFLVRLNHPNLPKVTDAFFEDDRFFLIMEFIEGVTLEARLKAAGGMPLDVTQVTEWALQITDVLDYLHRQEPPIIFRDLKPSNVMLQPDGNIRLIDFGIARRFQPGAVKDTALLGSVGYSPPEQFGRHQTDTRSDIYAFGATLHHLLTGRDPSQSPFKFTAARVLNPLVPEMLSNLLDRCVRLDADARPASIRNVALELVTLHDYLLAHPPSPPALSAPSPAAPAGESAPGAVPSGSANIILTRPGRSGTGRARPNPPSGPTNPSGRTPPASHPMPQAVEIPAAAPDRTRLFLIAACVLLLFGGSALAYVMFHTPRSGGASTPSGLAKTTGPASLPPGSVSTPNTTPQEHPASPPTKEETPPSVPDHSAHPLRFDSSLTKAVNVTQNEQGLYDMHIVVAGTVQGLPGGKYDVTALFYEADGKEMRPINPKSVHADAANGQLCARGQVEVATEGGPFTGELTLPMNEIPGTALNGMKFKCFGVAAGSVIGTSDFITVPPELLRNPNEHPAGP